VVTPQNLDAFRTAMRQFNWIDGQNLTIDVRYAEGQTDRLQALAGELASLPVDVIVGASNLVGWAIQAAKLSTPVVMIALVEPVAAGIVDGLAHPGGNITGMSSFTTGLVTPKVVELLHAALPGLTRLAVLQNPLMPSQPQSTIVSLIQESASSLGIQTELVDVRSANDFESAFVQTAAWQAQAMYVINDGGTLIGANFARVADLAVRYRLPTITASAGRSFPQAGGLMSYAPDIRRRFERAAYFVDRILRGARPADLPIEQTHRF
jgi:putative tryptophan/tyrosine transport system substrate-binding protein